MRSVVERVRGAIAEALPIVGLELGDLVAIGVFVVLGEISHEVDPVTNPVIVADTFVPFMIGWLFVSIPAGMYAVGTRESPRSVAVRTIQTWFVAVVLALTLRRSIFFRGGTTPLDEYVTFGFVAFAVGGVLLVAWRVAVVVIRARRRSVAPA